MHGIYYLGAAAMSCVLNIWAGATATAGGCLLNCEAGATATAGGCLLGVRGKARKKEKEYHFFNGQNERFNLEIKINGRFIDFCRFINQIKITQAVNSANLAELEIIADCGNIDFFAFASKQIEIYYFSETAEMLIYKGLIYSSTLNKNNKTFQLLASDEKLNKISNLSQNTINQIGYFCPDFFNEELNKEQEFNKRIETIPADYYFDFDGNLVLTNWQPKSAADIKLNQCDVLGLDFGIESTSEIVNNIELNIKFNYTRFVQRDLPAVYEPGMLIGGALSQDFIKIIKQYGLVPVPRVDSVLSAVGGAGWVVGRFNYSSIPDLSSGVIAPYYILDRESYVMAASWIFSKRWTQNVQEEYTISIKNNQSIDFFNEKSEEITLNLRQPESETADEKSDWQDYQCYFSPPSGSLKQGNDYFLAETAINRQRWALGCAYALNLAKTKLLKAHYIKTAQIETFFNKNITLSSTVAVNADSFSGSLKTQEIIHTFNLTKKTAETTAKLKGFKGFNGDNLRQTISRVSLPNLSGSGGSLKFGNFWVKKYSQNAPLFSTGGGGLAKDYCLSKDGLDGLYGYIIQENVANLINPAATVGTPAPVKFAIKTPDIEAELTDGLTATAPAIEQNLSIQDTTITAAVC